MTGERDWRPSAALDTLRRRAALLADIRAFMDARAVLEVDTGVLTRVAPAERHLHSFAVGASGYLVPSPEHALKRLLAAGAGPIDQLGHVFRAGEHGRWHNPEFCLLEWYRPHADMAALIRETDALMTTVAGAPPLERADYREIFAARAGIDPITAGTSALAGCAQRHGVAPVAPTPHADRVFWLDLLMSLVVQPRLGHDAPLCVTGFPADDAVLVAPDADDARRVQRFEVYWQGIELANGAQELTDPGLARRRMQREDAARQAAGESGITLDEALLAAMRHGLPRCAGVALGVDRLLALMLDRSAVADVLAFDWPRR